MGSLVSSYLYNYRTDASGNQVPPDVDASGNVIPPTDPSGNTLPVVDLSGNSNAHVVPECNVVFGETTCSIEDAPAPEPLVVPLSALVPIPASTPVPMPTPAPASTPTPEPTNEIVGSLTSVVSDSSATPHSSPAEPNHMQKARKRPNKRR